MVLAAGPMVESIADSLAHSRQTFGVRRVEPGKDRRHRRAVGVDHEKTMHEARDRYGCSGLVVSMQGMHEAFECRLDVAGGEDRTSGGVAMQIPSDFLGRDGIQIFIEPAGGNSARSNVEAEHIHIRVSSVHFRGNHVDSHTGMTAPSQLNKSHDAYAALRLPNFRRYFVANLVLFMGLQMQKVALGWEIYERTGSAMHLGYVGLAQFLPQVVLTLFAGYITDNYNRKRVLMGAVAFNTLAALGLAWNSTREGAIVFMYVLILAVGAARAFWMPARGAFLPRIVPLEIFGNAVSWNSSGFETASMAGPAIGGLLIAHFKSSTLVYLVNVAAGLSFLVLVMGITYRNEKQERGPMTMRSLSAGFGFVRKSPLVLSAMLLDTFGVLLGGATALMPIYAKDILQVGPRGLGWLMTAPSIGAFSMALLQAHRGPLRKAGRTLLFAVAGFGTVTIIFGVSRNFWLSMM